MVPRSVLAGVAPLRRPATSLSKVVERLEAPAPMRWSTGPHRPKDAHAILSDADAQHAQPRVPASISFDVVAERHPQAADAFTQLAAFPGGVPESVAIATLAANIDATPWQRKALATDSLDQLPPLPPAGMARQYATTPCPCSR